jgi:hypothetical protein
MRVYYPPLCFCASLLVFAGCTPKANTPLPGAEFLRATQKRWVESPAEGSKPITLSGAPQPAFIDVAVLATRHPAWKLAESLEKSDQKALRFSGIAAPQSPRALSLQRSSQESASGSLPRPAGESDEVISGASGYERPPQRIAARSASLLETQAKERQEGTLTSFLQDVQRKQATNRADERERLRADLKDEIEVSQRLALASLEPLLPSPAVQLEMTNLRIQLLPNAPGTEAESERARTRLAQLEAEWRAQLQAQAEERFDELFRLLITLPIEKRQAGYTDIEKTLSEQLKRDDNLRRIVEEALRERIAAGFGVDDLAPLTIQLPGVQLPPQSLGSVLGSASPLLVSAPSYRINNQMDLNRSLIWPSAVALAGKEAKYSAMPPRVVASLTATQKRAAELRRQAWQEANRWAKTVARRRHWQLQNRRGTGGQNVPDRTREALQLLSL